MDTRHVYRQLSGELAEKQAQLASLQQRVASLRRVVDALAEYDPSIREGSVTNVAASSTVAVSRVRRGPRPDSTAKRSVMETLLTLAGTYASTKQVVQALEERGGLPDVDSPEDTVRKVLSRMAKDGEVARRPLDGRAYEYAAKTTHPTDAEPPADTGGSGTDRSLDDRSLQEGGANGYGTVLRDFDQDSRLEGTEDRDHHHGASVVEAST